MKLGRVTLVMLNIQDYNKYRR